MTKKQRREELKRFNGWYLTPKERAEGRIKHAEEIIDGLDDKAGDYASIWLPIIVSACQRYGLTSKYYNPETEGA